MCDHLVEQVPPTVTWGSKFHVASLEGRSSGERIRILSARAASVAVNCNTVVLYQSMNSSYRVEGASENLKYLLTVSVALNPLLQYWSHSMHMVE